MASTSDKQAAPIDQERQEAGRQLARGDWQSAAQLSRRRLAESPEDATEWLNLSAALLIGGEWELAWHAAANSVKLQPRQLAAWKNLITARIGDAVAPEAELLTEALRLHGEDDELAELVSERMAAADPSDTSLFEAVAAGLIEAGQLGEALVVVRLAQPAAAAAARRLMALAFRDEQDELVAELATLVMSVDETDTDARRVLLELAVKSGDHVSATTLGSSLFDHGLSPYEEGLLTWALHAAGETADARMLLGVTLSRIGASDRLEGLRTQLFASDNAATDPFDEDRVALSLLAAALDARRWAVTLMCAEQLTAPLGDTTAAGALTRLAGELESHGRPVEALAATVMANNRVPGSVSGATTERLLAAAGVVTSSGG